MDPWGERRVTGAVRRKEGGMHPLECLRMIDSKTQATDKNDVRNHLLAYCGQDTLAMGKKGEAIKYADVLGRHLK